MVILLSINSLENPSIHLNKQPGKLVLMKKRNKENIAGRPAPLERWERRGKNWL